VSAGLVLLIVAATAVLGAVGGICWLVWDACDPRHLNDDVRNRR
jgi:hypothetical protein